FFVLFLGVRTVKKTRSEGKKRSLSTVLNKDFFFLFLLAEEKKRHDHGTKTSSYTSALFALYTRINGKTFAYHNALYKLSSTRCILLSNMCSQFFHLLLLHPAKTHMFVCMLLHRSVYHEEKRTCVLL